MKIAENGILREMTQKEIDANRRLDEQMRAALDTPTPEDRMNEIEAALIELAAMLTGGAG